MKFSNLYGYSLMLMPFSAPKCGTSNDNPIPGGYAERHPSFTTKNNTLLFFKSPIPDDEELYTKENKEALIDSYGDDIIARIDGLNIQWTYNNSNHMRERIIRKVPIDALNVTLEQEGSIIWAALIATQEGGWGSSPIDNTKDSILFIKSIDDWNNNHAVITFDKISGNAGDILIFKDLSFKLRDKSVF